MKALALIAALSISACTDEESSMRALTGAGYRNVTFTGYEALGCSDDDTTHTGFTAKGPTGVRVKGVVCCGVSGCGNSKGCTIRTF